MKRIFVIIAGATLFAISVQAQVVIAPPVVYITNEVPYGTFSVSNSSSVPQEVDLSFQFGYPVSDSLGKMYIDFDDSVAAQKYSCASWLNAFPTKFILNPGQQQTVHMSVSPPSGLQDGAYWSRLITFSEPQQKFVDSARAGVSANVIFAFKQITAVMYEIGKLETNVTIDDMREAQDSNAVKIYTGMTRGGNSPFLGTATVEVSNENGSVVYSDFGLIAVYMNFVKDFSIPLTKLPPGNYSAAVKITSDRPDIPPEYLLKTTPVSRTISFLVK